jgi:4-hydroxybenzoate polyprenyltransferase
MSTTDGGQPVVGKTHGGGDGAGHPPAARLRRAALALTVLHPVPSLLDALLVAALAVVAGAALSVAGVLAFAMLGFQVSIGSLNDLVDADADRRAGRTKPIPSGVVSKRAAGTIVVAGGAVGLLISAWFGLAVLLLGALGYGCGIAYDVSLRRRGLGWLCFSIALPTLFGWVWLAVPGGLPQSWPLLMLLATLAGPAIHLANNLADVDLDRTAGAPSLADRLGVDRARRLLLLLMVIIYACAWLLLWLAGPAAPGLALGLAASVLAGLGIAASWAGSRALRQAGWLAQAGGLALLALAWVLTVS